jgi:hypothetical protein
MKHEQQLQKGSRKMENQNTRETAQALVGQRVRSFDFYGRELEGERACYIVGTVIGILEAGDLADDGQTRFWDCDRYIIAVESRTFAGKEKSANLLDRVFPPLNGTPSSMGETMNGVIRINQEVA